MVGGCRGEQDSAHSGQGAEELRLELTALVRGDSLRATEAGYPAGNEGACHGFGCDVRDWDCFWPARVAVDRSEAVRIACRCWERPHEVDVVVY
jgi:hypothetical protein